MGEKNIPRFPDRSSRSRRVDGLREDQSGGGNNSTVVPLTPGQSRPGRSQLFVMVGCQPVTGRFWRQEGAASALFAVVRE